MMNHFHSSQPIYLQLADRIIKEIIRGDLIPSDKLPSVREMSMQAGINANTVQRTYRELERIKIIETRRGQGSFVTDNHEVLQSIRSQKKHEEIEKFVKEMQAMGYSNLEIKGGLSDYLQSDNGGGEIYD
ncbi:GntR family transcriptional regulator [Salirhabdus salicampi]|uniref:GntR family transcriptional regulator n=1 Tax=Salirhabdus salicampi TaxID=476102 RepID=UPI0020C499D2|nr:GntR family transcriptional regulator [Salirhabdus salicampi]MCP8616290.1 GntR family transcriptional regulator [Salirhabdus salicampi]